MRFDEEPNLYYVALLVSWHLLDRDTMWFSTFVSNTHWDSVCFLVAVTLTVEMFCLPKCGWHCLNRE